MHAPRVQVAVLLAAAVGFGPTAPGDREQASVGTTERVNVATDGTQANWTSYVPAVSSDGRYVAFSSGASNLVPGDTAVCPPDPICWDVFVRDRVAGATERVSVADDGTQRTGTSGSPSISGDGRLVAFYSTAALTPDDTNGVADVFVHDRQTGAIERVSVRSDGTQVDGSSFTPAISRDGSSVAFMSYATNLVADDTNGYTDVFVHDRITHETIRASISSLGEEGDRPSGTWRLSISDTGRRVAFDSSAHNLVPNDGNLQSDVFVHDVATRTTERVSVGPGGVEGNDQATSPSISGDGRLVAFVSWATNLVASDTNVSCVIIFEGVRHWVNCPDIFVRDLRAGTTERVNLTTFGRQARGESYAPAISRTGRFVAFESMAPNLVAGDTNHGSDIFLRDRRTARTSRISLTADGTQSACAGAYLNRCATAAAIDDPGTVVAFQGNAPDLVPNDTNDAEDIFVRDRVAMTDWSGARAATLLTPPHLR